MILESHSTCLGGSVAVRLSEQVLMPQNVRCVCRYEVK